MTANRADAPQPPRNDHEPTLEEIIRAKRPRPVQSVDELMARDVFPSEDEVDEFIEDYRRERQASFG
ncbi:MAG TPA: hypothetical protein VGM10_24670 [Actinocrinis sp.]